MKIDRFWAMPSGNTFDMLPIKDLLGLYINGKKNIIDPFSNKSKIAHISNDLNPEFKTDYNLDALEFLKLMKTDSSDLLLFDPPFSSRQAIELYKKYGKEKANITNYGYWSKIKNEIARVLIPGGICISFGWNSNGIGNERGFQIIHIRLIAHGGGHNDTIVTIEKKIQGGLF
jgi:hypothetical protein